ncbi:VWA domain-containing protein, partial [Zavarzinella formosa]|uniref:VWA domain-containing protein n=1 Tax=Zavarzinella formosa TaxID=360055 RepID=UPI000377710A
MGLLAPAFLLGFLAVAIPPLIHLLNRRRYDTLDWAAMQFLQVSERTRKKIFLEQFLLMLLRMGAICLLVLGVASPWVKSPWLAKISPRPNRAVVIVFDGSFSMGYTKDGASAHDAAKGWAADFVSKLQPGDAVAVLQAKQQPSWVVERLTTDLKLVSGAIQEIPKPRGGINLAVALQNAMQVLKTSGLSRRDIIILTDGQRHGFADSKSLERLELLSSGVPEADWPNVLVVNVVPDRPEDAPNWSLAPIQSTRGIAAVGREVKFKTELQMLGSSAGTPPKVRFEVDGRPAGEQIPPTLVGTARSPLTFATRFNTPGSHLVSVMIDDDALPGDNRQDFAIEVMPTIPVLLVNGEGQTGRAHGVDFLRDALAPANDKTPSFLLKIVSPTEFTPGMLTRPLGRESNTVPRVLILFNNATLRPDQAKAVEEFLSNGGGVFVTLGSRTDGIHHNRELYRDGKGWLPARLIEPVGDANDVVKAPRVSAASLESPFLEGFKSEDPGTLAGSAYFPRYWKMEATGNGAGLPITVLTNRQPLLVEKSFGKGDVILSAVPMDNSWRTNLTDLGDYVRLMHELVYYLAAARTADANLEAKQPIVFRPRDGERPGPVTVQPPDAPAQRIAVAEWPFIFDDTRDTGVYKLTTDTGKVQYFVVQPDAGESLLKRLTDDDRLTLKRLIPTLEQKLTPA